MTEKYVENISNICACEYYKSREGVLEGIAGNVKIAKDSPLYEILALNSEADEVNFVFAMVSYDCEKHKDIGKIVSVGVPTADLIHEFSIQGYDSTWSQENNKKNRSETKANLDKFTEEISFETLIKTVDISKIKRLSVELTKEDVGFVIGMMNDSLAKQGITACVEDMIDDIKDKAKVSMAKNRGEHEW